MGAGARAHLMLARGELIDGRYRVERLIGEGGMGAVYAVRDASGAAYALKVLLDASNETLRKRFLREGKAAAALSSVHATRVHGSGTLANGAPYLLMELLAGEDLWDVVHQRGPLSAEEAVDCILQAGEALTEAHRLGMVHRDIKPANLFLARQPDGTKSVKLLDFGISKAALNTVAPMTQLTQTGSVLGSPEYMSPEQLLSSSDVDARADLWSIGATLHELLSASHAFEGETLAEIVTAIMRDPPRPLREVRPDLSPALEAVVLRCLEKDPELRYSSMAALAHALRQAAPTRFEASPTLAGYAQLPTPSAFESSPTLAPSPEYASLAHAQTFAQGSAAAWVLRPDTRGAQAPTLPGSHTWPSASDARSTQAPTVVSAPAPAAVSRAGAPQPRRRWPLAVAALVSLSLMGGLATFAAIRAGESDGERKGPFARAKDDSDEDDGDERDGDDDATSGSGPNGDLELPRAKRLFLIGSVRLAEKAVAKRDLLAATRAAEKVTQAFRDAGVTAGSIRSPTASRAEHVLAQVHGIRALEIARAYDGDPEPARFMNELSETMAEMQRHAALSHLWDSASKNCPSVAAIKLYAEVSRQLLVTAQRVRGPQELRLHILAAAYAQLGTTQLRSYESLPFGRRPHCVKKLAKLEPELQKLKQAAEARSSFNPQPAPSPPRSQSAPNAGF